MQPLSPTTITTHHHHHRRVYTIPTIVVFRSFRLINARLNPVPDSLNDLKGIGPIFRPSSPSPFLGGQNHTRPHHNRL